MMCGLAASNGWHIWQMDVKTAFLNRKLEEEIYMHQLIGFEARMERVCRLKRAIYGLKQAENAWNKEWNRAMEELGYI